VSGGGIIVGFATAPGDEASDGNGAHSPFTAALLKELPQPGVEIQQALTRVKADVYDATKGEQEPWHNSNLRFEFYLNPAPTPNPLEPPKPIDIAGKAWAAIENTTSVAVLETFVQTFGDTVYGKMARARIAEVKLRASALPNTKKFRTIFSGPLDDPEAPIYSTFRFDTETREGPGSEYASRFSLKPKQEVKAIGAYRGHDNTTWIKVATADGNEGFAPAHDLLSPQQLVQRTELIAQGNSLRAFFDRAAKSWGPLGGIAGVWSYGRQESGCPRPYADNTLGYKMALGLQEVWWAEGDTLFRVHMGRPARAIKLHFRPEKTVKIAGLGNVRLYQIKNDDGIVIGLKGFKGNIAISRDIHLKGYAFFHRCGTIESAEADSIKLWSRWVELEQFDPNYDPNYDPNP
jgi:hypothetical protein